MVYYKPVKITINVFELAKIIIDIVMGHYKLLDSIVANKSLLHLEILIIALLLSWYQIEAFYCILPSD